MRATHSEESQTVTGSIAVTVKRFGGRCTGIGLYAHEGGVKGSRSGCARDEELGAIVG